MLILRLLWRWTHAVPELPAGLATWERLSANAGHYGLYVLMFASTLTGWALAGTFRTPMNKDAFGLPVPMVYVSQDRTMHNLFEEAHMWLSYALGALILIHIAGALRHHVIKRTDVLRRMWFGSKRA